jgi:hypothetical protein
MAFHASTITLANSSWAARDLLLHFRLDVLNWVQIWRVGRPIEYWYSPIFKLFFDLFGYMD